MQTRRGTKIEGPQEESSHSHTHSHGQESRVPAFLTKT